MDLSITNAMVALDLIVPTALALLVHHFYRLHSRIYLRDWTLFWLWLAAFRLARWVSFDLMAGIEYARPDRLIVTAIAAASLFIAIAHFVRGTFSAVNLRPLRPKIRRTLTVTAIAAGVGAVFYILRVSSAGQHLIQFNYISGFSLGLSYIGCGAALWRPGKDRTGSWLLLTIILVMAGAIQIGGALPGIEWQRLIGTPHVIFKLIMDGAIGIGMVIRLLDEERSAALSAATQVAHMVYHEELTGLANRSLLVDRLRMALTQAERRGTLLALIFIDIDGFKPVNDTLGHDVGDHLLKAVADRIHSVVRGEDTVARFGGDEFVILIPHLRAPEDTGRIGTKLTDAIRQPFQVGGHDVSVTTSVGIAIYPEDGTDADTLMKNADKAMYQAKEKGGDQFQLYSVSMNHRALEKLELEMSLRRALEFRQMELHFQPIIGAPTMELVGFEALLHWDHPTRGLLAAEDFMPSAERYGMLAPIGKFTVSEACRLLATWQKKIDSGCFVAINISSAELKEEDVLSHLTNSLEEYRLDPGKLELEITESSSSPDIDLQSAVLPALRKLGIRVTIDDFGNRFASLSQLRNIGAHAVKLSPVLTSDMRDSTSAVIADGVIGIAHGLHLKVATEGIGHETQRAWLEEKGCDRFQGPLFGGPIPADEVVDFIRAAHAKR